MGEAIVSRFRDFAHRSAALDASSGCAEAQLGKRYAGTEEIRSSYLVSFKKPRHSHQGCRNSGGRSVRAFVGILMSSREQNEAAPPTMQISRRKYVVSLHGLVTAICQPSELPSAWTASHLVLLNLSRISLWKKA
jgi:hypothetical protein